MHRFILVGFALLLAGGLSAQQDSTLLSRIMSNYRVRATIGLQLWTTYSAGMEVYDASTQAYVRADNRLNTQLRRSRFIFTGQPYERLTFNLTAALDMVGHDLLDATEAAGNNGPSPIFRIWNLWLQYQLSQQTDRLYVLAGYFAPPIGRESSTAALRSNSFEKAWSQNYIRRHLVGNGPGRAAGLLLAGQVHDLAEGVHLTYEGAVQNALGQAYNGNSTGLRASPLLTGRVSVHLGDIENATYSLIHKVNFFDQREGVTISLSGARQGETANFGASSAIGAEVLYNTAGFHLDGDYHFLRRRVVDGDVTSRGRTGYLRMGYNIDLPRSRVLEPVISYWFYRGPTVAQDIFRAQLTSSFTGSDVGLDIGANLYFNPDFKLSLFYAYRHGDAGEGNPVTTNNNYFQQPGVGAIQRGSYVGAGWVVLF